MTNFQNPERPVLAYGSLSLIAGYFATSVRVEPNGMLILAAALTAHPFAFRRGAMLRRRSLSHAMIMAGPEITRIIPINTRISFQPRPLSESTRPERAVPIIPNAIPMAAKIPANFAISNGGAGAAAFPSAAAGTAVGTALIFSVAFFIIFASFSAALLLMRFSTAADILRYGDQKACDTLIGLSTIFVITASHSTPFSSV